MKINDLIGVVSLGGLRCLHVFYAAVMSPMVHAGLHRQRCSMKIILKINWRGQMNAFLILQITQYCHKFYSCYHCFHINSVFVCNVSLLSKEDVKDFKTRDIVENC